MMSWTSCAIIATSLFCILTSEAIAQGAEPDGACSPVPQPVLISLRSAKPLQGKEERAVKPLDIFKECAACPEMVVVPPGHFVMGAPETEESSYEDERPQHAVKMARPFAVGRFAVTFDEWDACVAEGGCRRWRPSDRGWGRGRRPVININWDDARVYVTWLAEKTGKPYRLLSEAEREYATRAGTVTPFWWGSALSTGRANYDGNFPYPRGEMNDVYRGMTLPVDCFRPNPWGFYQVHGNVYEWVEDCWHPNYKGAPTDGSAWVTPDCDRHVLRGGSWDFAGWHLRAAARGLVASYVNHLAVGMRVARALDN